MSFSTTNWLEIQGNQIGSDAYRLILLFNEGIGYILTMFGVETAKNLNELERFIILATKKCTTSITISDRKYSKTSYQKSLLTNPAMEK